MKKFKILHKKIFSESMKLQKFIIKLKNYQEGVLCYLNKI